MTSTTFILIYPSGCDSLPNFLLWHPPVAQAYGVPCCRVAARACTGCGKCHKSNLGRDLGTQGESDNIFTFFAICWEPII